MKFDKFRISPELKRNLTDMGFLRTTDIQFKAIPAIMQGEDVLAIAQTGTGKTAAFAVPVINHIQIEQSRARYTKGIKCLVLVPTRELAQQIGEVFAKLSKKTRVSTYAVYGGVEQDPQIQQLAGGIDVLIATPGRMFDLIHQKFIDISGVQILVLDEADRMLDMGFINHIDSVKRKLRHAHQTLFFSATIDLKLKKLAYSLVNQKAIRIEVSPEKLVSRNVTHFVTKTTMDDKRHLLVNLMKTNPQAKTIAFVRTQVRAERVIAHLGKNGVEGIPFHGGLSQADREKNLSAFREKSAGLLVATDVSARGLDVSGINLVVNYDLPDDPENYVHRVGRTGRGFAKGEAVSFCSPEELPKLKAVEEFINSKIDELKLGQASVAEVAENKIEDMSIEDMLAAEEALFAKPKKKKPAKGSSRKTKK